MDHGGSLTCLARFAVGVVRHSAMPGMERVPDVLALDRAQEEGELLQFVVA